MSVESVNTFSNQILVHIIIGFIIIFFWTEADMNTDNKYCTLYAGAITKQLLYIKNTGYPGKLLHSVHNFFIIVT